ncbi:hypothetical protein GJ496_007340 [Pomphorhynchus laevis]|nr:hypothetical protein GJ496_007340 [Pomphorhynchus laevis]
MCFSLVIVCTDNYAVIVDTSRTWRNYRHAANAVNIYKEVRRLGIPDSNIILLLGDDADCDSKNSYTARLSTDIPIDAKCRAVDLARFVHILVTGQGSSGPKLQSHSGSNVLLYITGHGGVDFINFLGKNEFSNQMLADMVDEMWLRKRYRNLLVIIDSCKAATMFKHIRSPNFIGVSSSNDTEDGISDRLNLEHGFHQGDRFSYALAKFLRGLNRQTTKTLNSVFQVCSFKQCMSTITVWSNLDKNSVKNSMEIAKRMPLLDFFGSRTTSLKKHVSKMLKEITFM